MGRVTIIGLLKDVSKSTTDYRKFQVSSIKTLKSQASRDSRVQIQGLLQIMQISFAECNGQDNNSNNGLGHQYSVVLNIHK